MEQYQEIIIHWEDRKSIESLESIGESSLYQIYGNHHIYGRDVLLYIGISKNASKRFSQHIRGVFGYVNDLTVSVGKIEKFSDNLNLEIPESILVANHKPSYNKEFIHNLSPTAKQHKIIVINNGNNGMLKTCCTNFWWVPVPSNGN